MLTLEDVAKHYGESVAVDGVSLAVPAGQTTVLIGPSGCGKSTLLRLMLGLIEPSSGIIHRDFDQTGDLRLARQKCGYVIQDGGLFPHLTARGNVALLAKTVGVNASQIDSRLAELCELTSFDPSLLDKYPTELSGGQRQRVALMRALMLDPAVLFLDEPLGALDPLVRADLQRDLRDIFRRLQKTVVIVTHDMAEATYFADEIVLMRAGQIEQRGTPEQLENEPATEFVSQFLSAQRMLHEPEAA